MTEPRYDAPPLPAPPAPAVAAAAGEPRGPIAILVAHGMGQQIPFQTLDDVAEGLRRVDRQRRSARPGVATTAPTPKARAVVAGGERLQRLELSVIDDAGHGQVVHLYEAYWAPLTEGKVGVLDVLTFLFRGAIGGLRFTWWPFERALFNQFPRFTVPWRTRIGLALAFLTTAALVVLNVIVVAVAAARAPFRDPPGWLTNAFFSDLTSVLVPFVLVFFAFLGSIAFARMVRRLTGVRIAAGVLSIALLLSALAATIGAAIVALVVLWAHHRQADAAVLTGPVWSWWSGVPVLPWACWPLVVASAAFVRHFLIQYVGDVAAYVQPQALDRFFEVRQAIKDAVWKTARAVYSARPAYERVILVGHSLGSVVLYDVLNRLLSDEALKPFEPAVRPPRTRLLVTFGSPLDKTAFLFGAQGRGSQAREWLASTVQPLISDAATRPRWINIHSPWDIISGRLDFYDMPDGAPNPGGVPARVDNRRDPDATTLLGAHGEYWENDTVFRTILENM